MDSRPELPERVASVFPPTQQGTLPDEEDRIARAMFRLSQISPTPTTTMAVEYFLKAKVDFLEAELERVKDAKNMLNEDRKAQQMTDSEFIKELEPYLDISGKRIWSYVLRSVNGALFKLMSRPNTPPCADGRIIPRSTARLEDAYQTVMHARLSAEQMSACVPKIVWKSSQSKFKQDVLDHYCPREAYMVEYGYAWCHIIQRLCPLVRAVHIAPKLLAGDELAHLFGDQGGVFDDVRNGITLQSSVVERWDEGVIAIVPAEGETAEPTRWKCVVLDETKADDIVYQLPVPEGNPKITTRLRDVDGKELGFRGGNRPARRFLYFRFIISYLYAKRNGNLASQTKVDKTRLWLAPGRYLNKSTLATLALCVSGCELPESLVDGQTFEAKNEEESENAGILLSERLQKAWMESAQAQKQAGSDDDSDNSDSTGDDMY